MLARAARTQRMRLTRSPWTAFSLAHYVATEKKYYEAENLKVGEIVVGVAVGVLLQLAAGSLNIAQAATDQSLSAILRGAPIRIVAGAASNAPFCVVAARTIKFSGVRRSASAVLPT
jgi:ABC-type nitrate/sulfonate/bicarbonate transport system substrate-binding protein